MRPALFAILLVAAVPTLQAGTTNILSTPSYTITIEGCEEYVTSCDDVKYVGISKKTGKSIALTGKTVHTMGPDGVTPAYFLGYTFRNGSTVYFVGDDGELRVTRGSKVLVEETGVWKQ